MPTKKYKRSRHRKRKYTRRKRRDFIAGGPKRQRPIPFNGPVECCMCGNTEQRNNMLAPSICLQNNRERAHRICQSCWWNDFAIEGANHDCPGCVKHLPLAPPLQRNKPKEEDIIIIDDDE